MSRICFVYMWPQQHRLLQPVQLVYCLALNHNISRFANTTTSNIKNKYDYNLQQKLQISSSQKLKVSNHEWSKILTKAEKIVGYPTSFLNLRYLVSDEVANFANLLRKLMQTKHPLIKMARSFLTSNDVDTKRSLKITGLIVLLISKAAGIPSKNKSIMQADISDGIHNSQRSVAEIAEMIYMGSLIHKGVLDLKKVDNSEIKQMDQGNKLAVLLGDYLLASACKNLAKLHNTEVVSLMSQVIGDISQGMFEHRLQLEKKMTHLKIWYESINSNSSSLLANSAKASVLLVRHSVNLQNLVYHFAHNLDVTHKIWSDLTDFNKSLSNEPVHFINIFKNRPNSIINAVYKDKYVNNMTLNESIEYILSDCRLLFDTHYSQAMNILEKLEKEPDSEPNSIASLKSILNVMKNSI